MQAYEAIRWALDRLNKRNEVLNGEFLPDFYIPGVRIGILNAFLNLLSPPQAINT